MEYIDGQDLSELMTSHFTRGDLLPAEDVIAIGRAIANALDYAHKRGVIHRDVKPSNVMVASDGRVVLGDFGLALDMQEGSSGEAFGTPHYISPEQARRSTDAVPQSDLYSLGVILYEMLTGVVPFDDQSPTSVAIQHITQPPPDPRSLNPQLSAETAGVLLKALKKLLAERYQTGAELMDALDKALTGTKTDPMRKVLPLPPLPAAVLTGQDKTAHQRQIKFDATAPAASPAPTVIAPAARARKKSGAWWLIAAGILILVALGVFAVKAFAPAAEPTPSPLPTSTPQPATSTAQVQPTDTATGLPAASLTATTAATDTPEPTATPTPEPTLTPTLEVTDTPAEEASPIPVAIDTDTPTAAPTATVTPEPTETLPPNVTPTEKYPNWAHIVLYWDDYGFYLKNISTLNRSISPLSFERLDQEDNPQERFDGWLWAEFYPTLMGDRCMSIEVRAAPHYLRPAPCKKRYLSMRLIEADSGWVFWSTREGSTQFRILWREKEVSRCDISAGTCEFYIP
jgi:serine/threonine-protein kinase